jgi:glycosyltransferase involved in cell wall biosynthesis
LKRFPDSRFVVTGDGPLRPQLERLVNDLEIAERVEFRGEVPHEELPRMLGQADVFVSTSRSDGNNVSLNEAMACGAFPIATDIPANRAWIKHGHNGLLFPCQDANLLAERIIEALQKPEWREAVIAQNWGIICKKASWSENMFEMEHHYFRLLREKRK